MLSHPQSLKAGRGFDPSSRQCLPMAMPPCRGAPLGSRPPPDSCLGREWRDLHRAPTHARGVVQPGVPRCRSQVPVGR